MISFICGISHKYDTNQHTYKKKHNKMETDSVIQQTDLWWSMGRRSGGGKDWEIGISRGELLHIG